ncbi:hypothetical protein N658DRAFT_496152 [Parathielavia hyrcaniae]|uniref:Secreted protein n=1 Tax=Parathielavia hyrcaniae TaxID=113614 RepID=A0AAN6T2J1_9PEZI|nr:hypothetical protein N658DRAFT_496152 [Parathielavia hyrcaniae]
MSNPTTTNTRHGRDGRANESIIPRQHVLLILLVLLAPLPRVAKSPTVEAAQAGDWLHWLGDFRFRRRAHPSSGLRDASRMRLNAPLPRCSDLSPSR